MRKVFSAFIIALFTLSITSFAQDTTSTDTTDGMKKCPMMGAAMGMMMPRVVANLQDGSVLVLSGHQLLKYDSDLKLVQQVTIPQDTASMQSMKRMCPGVGNQGSQQ